MNKVLNFLGLCKKAGKLSLGFDAVVQSMEDKKSSLVLVTKDYGVNSLKKARKKAGLFSVEILDLNETMDDIYISLGKRCGIISINDIKFSDGIKSLACDNFRGNVIYDDKI